MFRIGILIIWFTALLTSLNGQKNSPVQWTFTMEKFSDSEYEIIATAEMNPSWVIYSQFTDKEGPIPTLFLIEGKEIKFEEKSKVIKEFDEMFDVDVMKFKERAVFSTKIKKSDNDSVTGSVEYMTCDGTRCLSPVEIPFVLKF